MVELRAVTRENLRTICKLDAGDGGAQVAPNAVSIAEAYFYEEAWFRAVYADGEAVGFLMLYDPTAVAEPEEPDWFLWRLMIDQRYQGRGYGQLAVRQAVDHVRAQPGARRLLVSHVREAQRLARFYQALGFEYTGCEVDGELELQLRWE